MAAAVTRAGPITAEQAFGIDANAAEARRAVVNEAVYNHQASIPWRNVMIDKCAQDLVAYQSIIASLKPDIIIECLPGDTLVVGAKTAVRAMRRFYDGPLIEIATASDYHLSTTPNHPILTGRGWVPAGELNKSDHLISRPNFQGMRVGNPDIDDVPTPIGDIYDSFQRTSERTRLSGMNFDGNIAHIRQVSVVPTNRHLRSSRVAAVNEPVGQYILSDTNLTQCAFSRDRSWNKMLSTHPLPLDRSRSQSERGADSVGVSLNPCLMSLNLAHSNPGTFHDFPDPIARDTHSTRNRDGTLPVNVAPDNLVHLGRRPFRGHVYNLQTTSGFYHANGIVVHNCGTWFGGSALFFADMCELNGHGQVLSIDIGAQPNLPDHDRITYLRGDSKDPATLARANDWAGGKTGMVILDSDHSKAHVLAELDAYADFVGLGHYLIVEDSNVNGHPVRADFGPGPWEAVMEWLPKAEWFAVDSGIEPFVTFAPQGYLRRFA